VGWRFTQGGGLGGLALGYYQAAPLGLRKGEPDAGADSRRPFCLRWRCKIRSSRVSSTLTPRRLRISCSFGGYEGMIHFRIIGGIWLVSCLVAAAKLPFDLWSMATRHQYGFSTDDHGGLFWISQFLVEVSFLVIMIIGWGLIRLRRWAAVAGLFWGIIALLICLWFILTQGTKHGPEPYAAIWCGVALSAYTIFALWRFKPYDRIAEPGASPL
jgi:hypothetical protein